MMAVTSKSRSQETFPHLLSPCRSVASKFSWEKKNRLQGHKRLFDQIVLAEAPSDQPANNQSSTPTYVSEVISDYPAPVKVPVN